MAAPQECPNCGADVPRHAVACPECGSDESTGWSERAEAGNLDLPDDEDFDYEDFVRSEFGGEDRTARKKWVSIGAAVLLLVFILAWLL